MSDQATAFGSLDELITTRLSEFIQLGIDSLNKVSLVEAAWHHPAEIGTVEQYSNLIGTAQADAIERDLNQLVESRLMRVCQSGTGERIFVLTSDAVRHDALSRLLELWADPNFRARAVAQLHYAGT